MTPPPIEIEARGRGPLGMPAARFLRDYWQKHPLLIRQAFADFQAPLSAEDLAGLACEENALARLVRYDRKRDQWNLQHGPFAESVFPALPRRDWTLLVQDVDRWDADVRALLDHFDFLPRWRIDDVMVSFAAPGGSVGPHTDHYDVFLLQGMGRRRWQIDIDPAAPGAFRDDAELKLLRQFSPSHEFVLEPGDMLYLPPELGHFGEAVDACMTFSIGMRAPSKAELLGDLADFLGERLGDADRYADPDLVAAKDAAQIDDASLTRARAAVIDTLTALPESEWRQWLGGLWTRYRSSGMVAAPPKPPSLAQLTKRLADGAALLPHPFSRLAWSGNARQAWLFASGEAHACDHEAARMLAAGTPIDAARFADLGEQAQALAHRLVVAGHLALTRPAKKRANRA